MNIKKKQNVKESDNIVDIIEYNDKIKIKDTFSNPLCYNSL